MAGMVRRTRKVEGWSGGTGGAVRAQHDAIRAGTRRSLRSERRDASAESIVWIARQVIADARGVPLSSRITLTVCSDGRSCFAFIEPQVTSSREEGRRETVSRTVEAAAAFRSARKRSSPDDLGRTSRWNNQIPRKETAASFGYWK